MAGDSVSQLLAAARDALDGALSLPASRCTRAAALFARSALESLVDDAVERRDPGACRASMRVKLICLATLDADIGRPASWAWHALSETCHQHAYELTPTTVEIMDLLGQVRLLAARI
ncbi:MAG: hypothetical protein QG597_1879 [Actinomycetota bacterium]|nr:hypothetical protein [Actinomycetota bacterium]